MDNELERLRAEVARLRALLEENGIDWKPKPIRSSLSLEERVGLFRSLFVSREDVFARRWTSTSTGKSGYQPVCVNKWRPGCNIKKGCSECKIRHFQPLGYENLYEHLAGRNSDGSDVIGIYAVMEDNTCRFLCADFDDKSCEHGYQNDVRAYVNVCREWEIPAYVERSRSGNGAHVWILFSEPVTAKEARRLGNAILTEAMEREGKMSFKSYDRFFPNQDYLPDGGFGNLVALPLQGQARKKGNSVFVDDNFNIISDQWVYLQYMKRVSRLELQSLLAKYDKEGPLGTLSTSSESAPWECPIPKPISPKELPSSITITLANGIYIPIKGLPAKAVNFLKRLAAFKNPEFYANQAMRLPTYHLSRVVSCSEMTDEYLILPRGCEEALHDFFREHGAQIKTDDKRQKGIKIGTSFNGEPWPEQQKAIDELVQPHTGTINATTAFGKTVAAIALIDKLKTNTLILVHTNALLEQWRKQLNQFLILNLMNQEDIKGRGRRKKRKTFGALSSTENSLNGHIDIALIQSCISRNEVKSFVRDYGMVIVDECHHVSAVKFEQVLKEVTASRVYGLTATPIRKDGHQPIIFMQCGPIRFTADSKAQIAQQSFNRILVPRFTTFRHIYDEKKSFSQIIQNLAEDEARNQQIVKDVADVLTENRSPIILTARTAHVELLAEKLKDVCPNVIKLLGSESAKAKKEVMERLGNIGKHESMVVIATGKYVGEGFDLPRLDTLFLALPVSWKGLIAQYAGRLHREYEGKKDVKIYDYIDLHIPECDSMYRKRLRGYRAIGYSIATVSEGLFAEPTTETIFDSSTFEASFMLDLSKAKKTVLISCRKLVWKRPPQILEKLNGLLLNGIHVQIVISQTGFNEKDVENYGIPVRHSPESSLNCAIVDGSLAWYGDTNFFGRSHADASAIRIKDVSIAQEILKTTYPITQRLPGIRDISHVVR